MRLRTLPASSVSSECLPNVYDMNDDLDGCELDFTKEPLKDDERESLLVPEGEEEDEEDA
jgi:hypothetical protein